MNWADRLEAWLGRAWDGRRKGRRGGLQPVQIARALESALLAGKRVSILRTYVPNFYQIFLHPREWEDLRRIQRTLTAEMVEYLRDVAEREGVAFVSPPQVQWRIAPQEPQGRVRVVADFLEPPAEQAAAPQGPAALSARGQPEMAVAFEEEAPDGISGAPSTGWPPGGAGGSVRIDKAANDLSAPWEEEEEDEPAGGRSSGAAPAGEAAPAEATRRYRATPETEEPSGRLVVVEGPDQGTSYLLDGYEIVIGRAAGGEEVADLTLTDPAVSRRHARLLWKGGLWWLEDLGSTNGTYVNGDLIDSGWLQVGDRVGVGNSELVLEDEEPSRS